MKRAIAVTTMVVVALAAGVVAAQMQRRGAPGALPEVRAEFLAPPRVPAPITRNTPARVIVALETTEAGDERPDIFKALTPEIAKRHSGH